jgi:2-C-methyl-D-erythritol 4-phosphate cytidylyltransferase
MPEVTRAACIIVAAGSGSRLGADVPKAFVTLAGEPLLAHAVRNVLASAAVGHVVVVAPRGWLDRAEKVAADVTAALPSSGTDAGRQVSVVAGGATRQDSVAAGLASLPDDETLVLVHDAARCLAPPSMVARVVDALRAGHRAVVPGLPVVDTIKLVWPGRAVGGVDRVVETVSRDELRISQTPQGFHRATLAKAHEDARAGHAGLDAMVGADVSRAARAPRYTDDAEMAEAIADVVVVPGDPLAFKITGPEDLVYAEWVLRQSATTA